MENEQWGVGDAESGKAFSTVSMGSEKVELFFGEHPHSRQDNTIYARLPGGGVTGFDGHRIPIKIEIEEYNYLKSSGLSGDQVRKGCKVRVFADGIQIFDDFTRGYEMGFRKAQDYIDSLELMWDWFPKFPERAVGRVIGYREQLCKIKRVAVSRGCLELETLDGKPFKRFLWQDKEDFEEGLGEAMMVGINSEHITWYPKQ